MKSLLLLLSLTLCGCAGTPKKDAANMLFFEFGGMRFGYVLPDKSKLAK